MPDLELLPGAEIAGYRIEGLAGRGGMGVVYRATQLSLDRTVALKVIKPEMAGDEQFRARFKRESRMAASIRHPGVIAVYDAREEDGVLLLAMDFVEGTDLADVIRREGRLAPERAAAIVQQLGDALDAAHARGLVHRDVKPANVLIAHENGEERVYLTDFGLTKDVSSESGVTKTGVLVGTIDYLAPEQVSGEPLDARSDVYALGCVLFHALTGQVPYPRETFTAKLYAHAHLPPPSVSELVPHVPPPIDGVVARAMATAREDRYPSAGDVGRAAVAATEGRAAPDTAERSVATGRAAVFTHVEERAAPAVPTPPPPPTVPVAAPTPPPVHTPSERPPAKRQRLTGARVTLLAVLALLIGVLVLAAVLSASGERARSPKRATPPPRTPTAVGPTNIVPGKAIGPVALNMSKADVDAALGVEGSGLGSSNYSSDLGSFRVLFIQKGGRIVRDPARHDPARIFVGLVRTSDPRYRLDAGGTTLTSESTFDEVRGALAGRRVGGSSWRVLECEQTGRFIYADAPSRRSGHVARTEFEFPPGAAPLTGEIRLSVGPVPKRARKCFEDGG